MYDCNGKECVCEGVDEVNSIADFPTKGECLEVYGGRHIVDQDKYVSCMLQGSFPPPPCDDDDQCCLGGGAGGNGGGSPPPPIPIVNTASHSPSLKVDLHYNPKNKTDRGLGAGWSHTYLHSLYESDNGNIILTRDTGFSWLYLPQNDTTYKSAPYDRTTLSREGNTFVATLKDGTTYLYRNGRLERIEDLHGNFQTLSYSANNLLESVSDNFGRSLQFSYNAVNGVYHLQGIKDPNNNRYSFIYEKGKNEGRMCQVYTIDNFFFI